MGQITTKLEANSSRITHGQSSAKVVVPEHKRKIVDLAVSTCDMTLRSKRARMGSQSLLSGALSLWQENSVCGWMFSYRCHC